MLEESIRLLILLHSANVRGLTIRNATQNLVKSEYIFLPDICLAYTNESRQVCRVAHPVV